MEKEGKEKKKHEKKGFDWLAIPLEITVEFVQLEERVLR